MIYSKCNLHKLVAKANKTGIMHDSRGVSLSTGDYVMLHNTEYPYGQRMFICKLKIINSSDGIELMFTLLSNSTKNMHNYKKCLLFKLDFDISLFKNLTDLVEDCYPGNIGDAYTMGGQGLDRLAKFVELEWKLKNKRNNTNGFPIHDYIGKSVKMGDFVLYQGMKGTDDIVSNYWSYGVVISQTQVLTEHLTVITLHQVLVITDYSENEKLIFNGLTNYYKRMVKSTVMKKSKQAISYSKGDLCLQNNKLYLYLGHIDISATRLERSCYQFSDNIVDKNKNYWLCLCTEKSYVNVHDINDLFIPSKENNLYDILLKTFNHYSIEEGVVNIDTDFYATYHIINKFSFLSTSDIDDTSIHLGQINLNEEYDLPLYKDGVGGLVKLFMLHIAVN